MSQSENSEIFQRGGKISADALFSLDWLSLKSAIPVLILINGKC